MVGPPLGVPDLVSQLREDCYSLDCKPAIDQLPPVIRHSALASQSITFAIVSETSATAWTESRTFRNCFPTIEAVSLLALRLRGRRHTLHRSYRS